MFYSLCTSILLLFFTLSLSAQGHSHDPEDCGTDGVSLANINFLLAGDCHGLDAAYVPDEDCPECTPIRYIKINVHIVRDENGENNFDQVVGVQLIKDMLKRSNERWAINEPMNLHDSNTGAPPNLETRIRYVLYATGGNDHIGSDDDGIYFWNDTNYAACPYYGAVFNECEKTTCQNDLGTRKK